MQSALIFFNAISLEQWHRKRTLVLSPFPLFIPFSFPVLVFSFIFFASVLSLDMRGEGREEKEGKERERISGNAKVSLFLDFFCRLFESFFVSVLNLSL